MKEINELLKQNNIKPLSYKIEGNVVFVDTNKSKLVVKKNNIDPKIIEYLNNRNANYLPETLFSNNYIITKYEKDSDIPKEQKMIDLIDLISNIHSKTSIYKETTSYDYKTIYEDLINNYDYLYDYYYNYISKIDDKIFYSPSEYLLARNISYIFDSINTGRMYLDSWYKKVDTLDKMKVSIIHNNLDLNHFIRNKKSYLISWDKSKIDMPIFDLYKLYNKYYLDYNFYELLNRYSKNNHLNDYEKELLYVLILMPSKIESSNEYNKCIKISNEIDRLYKANKLITTES